MEGVEDAKTRTPKTPKTPKTPRSGKQPAKAKQPAKKGAKTPAKCEASAGAKAGKAAEAARAVTAADAATKALMSRHYPNAQENAGPEGYYWLPSFLVQEDMLGEALVGRRVRVWWISDRCHYEANVVAFDREAMGNGQGGDAHTPGGSLIHGRHRLVYVDDGVVMHEMLVPHKGDWQLLVDERVESEGLRRKRASSIDSADDEFQAFMSRAASEGAKHRKVLMEEVEEEQEDEDKESKGKEANDKEKQLELDAVDGSISVAGSGDGAPTITPTE